METSSVVLFVAWFVKVKVELQQASSTLQCKFAPATCPLRVTWRGLPLDMLEHANTLGRRVRQGASTTVKGWEDTSARFDRSIYNE